MLHSNEKSNSHLVRLCVNSSSLKKSVLSGGRIFLESRAHRALDVDAEKEVRRCLHCQRYGHSQKFCKSKAPICGCCSGEHKTVACPTPKAIPTCPNCKGNHPAGNNRCHAQILAILGWSLELQLFGDALRDHGDLTSGIEHGVGVDDDTVFLKNDRENWKQRDLSFRSRSDRSIEGRLRCWRRSGWRCGSWRCRWKRNRIRWVHPWRSVKERMMEPLTIVYSTRLRSFTPAAKMTRVQASVAAIQLFDDFGAFFGRCL